MKWRIRDVMNERGISGPKLAEMANIKYRTLDEFIRRGTGNVWIIFSISKALGMTIDDLLVKEDDDSPLQSEEEIYKENTLESEEIEIEHIKDIDERTLYGMTQKIYRNNPDHSELARLSHEYALKIRFEAKLKDAIETIHVHRENGQEKLALVFFNATLEETRLAIPHLETLVLLCEEFDDRRTIENLLDKYTRLEFIDRNILIPFAYIIAECGFKDEAALCFKCLTDSTI